jgi:hypothetical protein
MSPPDGAAAIRAIIDKSEHVSPEPPRPLMRELPPADAYPVDALGDVLGSAVRAIHDRVQAPLAICGNSVLAAAALAAQAHADVVLPIGIGQCRPLSLYLVTIAASGERKTVSDREAMWPIHRREAVLREQYPHQKLRYDNDRAAWDAARSAAVKAGKGNRDAIRAALDALGPPPDPPLVAMLTCPEPTYEGLCKLYLESPPSLGLLAAEGGQFIGGHGMRDEAKLCTAAGLSSLWDGDPIRRVRSGDGATVLPGRRLSMHLMATPAVAELWLKDRLLADQGILSRLLISDPDSAMGSRMSRADCESADTAAAMAHYGARLLSMIEMPLPLARNRANELAPRHLTLSADALKVWIAFADHIETLLLPDGEMRPISGLANKLPEHAARIAGVLTLVRDADAAEIVAAEMAAGIELAQHYAAEALRLHAGSRVSVELRLAQQALDWISKHWPEPAISLPDLYQRGPTAIRDAATARKIVVILEDHGWLARIAQGAVVAGVRRRDAWTIVRGQQ